MKQIDFPFEEIETLQNQARIITTRVSQEYNFFHTGEIVQTPWKQRYIVSQVQKIKNIKDHPYYAQLTQAQIRLISKYKRIDVIELKKIST